GGTGEKDELAPRCADDRRADVANSHQCLRSESCIMRAMLRFPAYFIVTVLVAWSAAAPAANDVTLELRDYVTFPITGMLDGKGQTDGMLARINVLREEPGGASRLFVNDLNGPLYIIEKSSKKLSTYLDFNGREGHHGLFRHLAYEVGFANGLYSFQFDPDYKANGKFYTVHIE